MQEYGFTIARVIDAVLDMINADMMGKADRNNGWK
jgi:hypothetical protein